MKYTNVKRINYKSRSGGAQARTPSFYTQSVYDVQVGISDITISDYWITSERLRMTPYTTPLFTENVVLFVKKPEPQNSFRNRILTTVAPFDPMLWLTLVVSIFAVGILSIWFSNERGLHHYWYDKIHGKKWKEASKRRKVLVLLFLVFDAFNAMLSFFFSASVEVDLRQSVSTKILMCGFGFLILITTAAYTANLVAFLTQPQLEVTHSSMPIAIRNNAKICSSVALKSEVTSQWPQATFVFKRGTPEMLDAFDQGKCDAISVGLPAAKSKYMVEFCERGLVFSGALVTSIPVAFPTSRKFDAAISYAIKKGIDDGINILDIEEQYLPAPKCNLELDPSNLEDSELQSLSVSTMTLPLFVLAVCAILAVCVKLWREYVKKPESRLKTLNGMKSMRGLVRRSSYMQHSNKHLFMRKDENKMSTTDTKTKPIVLGNQSKPIECESFESAMEENVSWSTKGGPATSLTTQGAIKAMEDMQEA
eukprot:CAMPEP_0194287986 /NCGR_PEP_ID=MMETSP0169-20130528/35902_1 /TAXON_ID=218684 /ORGANISM="Corethron pennatum, Strain L29A3" /LENGTH=479 /DNA_ID=CAMNT_0039034859 /DNA_START=659 /DNA_END=2095 /DNA_ORIENTATION=+